MATCYGCGAPIEFRHIDGRVVPLGCQCSRGEEWTPSLVRDPGSVFGGIAALDRPLTYWTVCWWCGAEVFFHTNGNGDCVLLDPPLGSPWPVHACWQQHRDDMAGRYWRRVAVHLTSGVRPETPIPDSLASDALRALKSEGGPFDFLRDTLPTPHTGAPVKAIPSQPGPWLFAQWIQDRVNTGGRHHRLLGPTGPWETLTLTNAVEFVVAGSVCGHCRVGDLVVVQVEVRSEGRAAIYWATQLAIIRKGIVTWLMKQGSDSR